jgi:hypothetical protein
MFWDDILRDEPGVLQDVPQDAIPLEWGYEADHPFDANSRLLAERGLTFYVCPGTSSWNSLAGRTDNMLANVSSAAEAGRAHGAAGLLITDWGDNGHIQPMSVSYPGFLAAACLAWNPDDAPDLGDSLHHRLDLHAFGDGASAMGRAALDLGNAYRETGARCSNGSALFYLVTRPGEEMDGPRLRGIDPSRLARTKDLVERAAGLLSSARPRDREEDLCLRELRWAAGVLSIACDLGMARLRARSLGAMPGVSRNDFELRLRAADETLRALWRARSRDAGLETASATLLRALDAWR